MTHKNKYPNALAQARRRLRLSRKRVAQYLRIHPTTVQKYELGVQLPSLLIALRLEALYRMPIAFLYPELFGQLRQEIRAREEGVDEAVGANE